MKGGRMLIGGTWVEAGGATIDVVNPATEEAFARVPQASEEEVDKAVAAAGAAFPAWAGLSPAERGRYLRAAGELVMERHEEIGRTMTEEQGKPLAEARGFLLLRQRAVCQAGRH